MVTGATAAGARHVPGHRRGPRPHLRHAQRQDGQVSAEHRDHVRRHPAAAGLMGLESSAANDPSV